MPSYTISFEVRRPDTVDLPTALLSQGAYQFTVDEDGSVEIAGNRDGLLFLSEVLVRCALGEYTAGQHVHLPLDSRDSGPNLDASPELTINAATAKPQKYG